MIILGYFFTVLNYITYCLSRFMKSKAAILALDLVAKIFTTIGLYYFNSLSGAYITIAVFFLLIVANIKEHLHKEWLWGYIFFQSLYVVILCCAYEGVSSILIFSTVTINLFGIWFLSPQQMRLFGCISCFAYFAYMVSIHNWAGVLEIFALLSNVLSFIKYKKKKQIKKFKL